MIIDQLPLLATAQTTDEMPIERGVTTYKVAVEDILAVANSDTTSPKDGTAAIGSSAKFARQDHRHPLNVAQSGTPEMDGTASLGSATDYARTDHVHPTDTSRQETLVSGTNIKTINNNSLLGSGDITIGGAVDSVNGQTGTVVLDADDVGAMAEWNLLWTNASPTSSFAAQTIPLDLSEYDFVVINSRGSTSVTNGYTNFQPVGTDGFIVASGAVNARRSYQTSGSGITFGNYEKYTSYANWSSSGDNTQLIPYKIYGIKGVTT